MRVSRDRSGRTGRRGMLGAGSMRVWTVLLTVACGVARGANPSWVDGSGNWSSAGSWYNGVLPITNDSVNLTQSDAINRTVTLDISTPGLNRITIDSTGIGLMTVLQNDNTLTLNGGPPKNTGIEFIGSSGAGAFVQTGGTNVVNTYIIMGANAHSAGSYNLSGTGVLNDAGYLALANSATATATFSLSGSASVNVSDYEMVGGYGSASFTQTSGTNTANLYLALGNNNGSGTYSLSGTGVNTVGYLLIANGSGSTGTYTLADNGSLNVINSQEEVGSAGTGQFIQTGGTNTITQTYLCVGYSAGAIGTYSLSGGALAITGSQGMELLGNYGNGTINQTGGTHSVPLLYVGAKTGSIGIYNLSGGSASIGSANLGGTNISNGGAGTIAVSGTGNLTISGTLAIYNDASNVSLNGGLLSVGLLNTNGNPARLSWITGPLSITGSAGLTLGANTLGNNVVIDANHPLAVTNALTIPAGTMLTIDGGAFSTSALVLSGSGQLHNRTAVLSCTGTSSGGDSTRLFIAPASASFVPTTAAVTRRLATYASFAGLGASADGDLNTHADLLAGEASVQRDITVRLRTRDAAESLYAKTPPIPAAPLYWLHSDILDLSGMGGGTLTNGREQTDPFALQLSYDASTIGDNAKSGTAGSIYLAWLDPNWDGNPTTTGDTDLWRNATTGDFSTGTTVITNYQGSWATFANTYHLTDYSVRYYVGSWGVDTVSNTVWAVLDHNSQFAVLAVPEPASLALLTLGAIGLLGRHARKHVKSQG